jgi:cobyrinic acid a,c-diamide synthase
LALLIAAPCSSSGKTLLCLLLAAAARSRGIGLQTFKVGPDYLDPQLLASASGLPCRNLDLLLCGAPWVRQSFHWWSNQVPLSLVEGVMGLYDGRGPSSEGSSAAIALELNLPVLLMVEASRQAGSLAALVRGFRDHEPKLNIAGVVLNGVSTSRHQQLLQEAMGSIAMPVLGVIPRDESLELPSRHLGLVPPAEQEAWPQRLSQLGQKASQWLQLEKLLALMANPNQNTPQTQTQNQAQNPISWSLGTVLSKHKAHQQATHQKSEQRPCVVIAKDKAFHFCYPELPEWLEALGCQVQWWAPLEDQALPEACAALVLPGGYPELQAKELSQCKRSLGAINQHCRLGLPLYAECGGLLLLGQELLDVDGEAHPMAGVLPFRAQRGALSLGYRGATPLRAGLVLRPGEQLQGHEFHRWQLQEAPAQKAAEQAWRLEGWGVLARVEGWTNAALHASWLHLHWGGCPSIPLRLRDAAVAANAKRQTTQN